MIEFYPPNWEWIWTFCMVIVTLAVSIGLVTDPRGSRVDVAGDCNDNNDDDSDGGDSACDDVRRSSSPALSRRTRKRKLRDWWRRCVDERRLLLSAAENALKEHPRLAVGQTISAETLLAAARGFVQSDEVTQRAVTQFLVSRGAAVRKRVSSGHGRHTELRIVALAHPEAEEEEVETEEDAAVGAA